jgi:hypothetical protein
MSHPGIFTTLIMGAAVVEFGLTGISGPASYGAAEPANERAGAVSGQQAASGPGVAAPQIVPQNISADQYSEAVMKRVIPPATVGGPPPGYQVPAGVSPDDINAGVYHLDNSVRQIPGYAMKMIGQVERHGIAALAYEDPEMKRAGHALGAEVGTGIHHLVNALGKNMTATAHESIGKGR